MSEGWTKKGLDDLRKELTGHNSWLTYQAISLIDEIERLQAENKRIKIALESICALDLKPYENEKFYGSDKLKMIAYEAQKNE